MSLSDLTSSHLKELVRLISEKEAIQAELAKVEATLKALEGGKDASSLRPIKRRKMRLKRGALKDAIMENLQVAGKAGTTTKDIAVSIGAAPASVAVWFYTTGKKIREITKLGPGRYSLRAA